LAGNAIVIPRVTPKPSQRRWWASFECNGKNSDIEDEGRKDVSQATLIWRAIKLPIYSVALVPLTVSFLVDNPCQASA